MSRLATVSAAAALAAFALLAPTAASAAPILESTALAAPTLAAPTLAAPTLAEDATSSTCVVTGGELQWGVKESFRSYISGSIANGEWVVADGTNYETPLFSWANPVGEVDAETGEGTISFTGSIHFTGHDGVLDLLFANPTIKLIGDGTGQLLLDTKSNNMQGELVIDEQQAYVGKIEGIGQADPVSGALDFADLPVVLTADGAAAFGQLYSSGEALDPLALALQFGPCEGGAGSGAVVAEPDDVEVEAVPISAEDPAGIPWVPIIVGGVALIVIGVTVGMLVAGRKKGDGAGAGAGGVTDDAGGADGAGA